MSGTIYIEKRIVGKLVDDLLAAGFKLTVNDGEEDVLENSTDKPAIMGAMWSTDEDRLFAFRDDLRGWFYFVHGNGVDVISDYTTNLEPFQKGADALRDAIDDGKCSDDADALRTALERVFTAATSSADSLETFAARLHECAQIAGDALRAEDGTP